MLLFDTKSSLQNRTFLRIVKTYEEDFNFQHKRIGKITVITLGASCYD